MIVRCKNCGRATTSLEAELRVFNVGRCGMCNGELEALQPNRVHDEAEGSNRTMTREDF